MVVKVPEDHYDEAIHHLRWNFFADEPLNNAVGLCKKGESQRELERHCLQTLKQGYSRMLVDKKGAVSDTHRIMKYDTDQFSLYFIKMFTSLFRKQERKKFLTIDDSWIIFLIIFLI